MDRTTLLLLVMALFVAFVVLMIVGWNTRKRRQRGIAAPDTVPAEIGAVHGEFEGLYVSTTLDGQPLNRVVVRGLGYRARASITVAEAGVVLALRGGEPIFIRSSVIREVTRARYTIDRVVEEGGLVLLAWNLGDTAVDSYLRLDESQKLIDAIASLIPVTPGGNA
jgi:hypothetical protein